MSNLFTLRCPTCGASLQVAGELNRFVCQHCGNNYLLERRVEELSVAEQENIQPTTIYTQRTQQWLTVAGYTLYLHHLAEEPVKKKRVLYIDVEYRNASPAPLTCRHDQWLVFDGDGYTYEPLKDFSAPDLYERNGKRYLGMTRVITPEMRLRGWLAFVLPPTASVKYLQFSGGSPVRTVEFGFL